MGRSAHSFGRQKASNQPLPTILVICEDSKSSKTYIEDAAQYFRIKVHVLVKHVGKTDPAGIVDAAIKHRKKFDRVYCLIDRDTHDSWDTALRLADEADGVTVIPSYPCFEYWLVLHFISNRKPYVRQGNKSPADCCISDLKKCPDMDGYEKGSIKSVFDALITRLPVARRNAVHVLKDAFEVGELNPSTQIHRLIDDLEGYEVSID